jgi:hypothetical protein
MKFLKQCHSDDYVLDVVDVINRRVAANVFLVPRMLKGMWTDGPSTMTKSFCFYFGKLVIQ